jgi:AraC-like DNA-binding protein
MCGAPDFRQIRPGFERIETERVVPRHAHFAAYASIVLAGGYDQAGYAGRMRLRAGDVLIQPTLDRHESRMIPGPDLHLLRLDWRWDGGLGGVYRLPGVELVIRAAERDPTEASALLAELVAAAPGPLPRRAADWPDLLALDLTDLASGGIGAWAHAAGLARETVSRGFARAFGVGPQAFSAELRARAAWLKALEGVDGLAGIAADLGYADQPHMTRAVRALTGAPPAAWRRQLGSNRFKTRGL